jgi:hypothetical protein
MEYFTRLLNDLSVYGGVPPKVLDYANGFLEQMRGLSEIIDMGLDGEYEVFKNTLNNYSNQAHAVGYLERLYGEYCDVARKASHLPALQPALAYSGIEYLLQTIAAQRGVDWDAIEKRVNPKQDTEVEAAEVEEEAEEEEMVPNQQLNSAPSARVCFMGSAAGVRKVAQDALDFIDPQQRYTK